MIPLKVVYNILIRNLKKTNFPFPIDMKKAHKWAYELGLPRGGETVLYTSCLYQLVPYIDAMVKFLEKAEKSSFWRFGIKMYSSISFLEKFSGLFIRVSDKDFEPIYQILKAIALMLKKSGIEFGYLYEDDIYSGALFYDLGLDDLFAQHLKKVDERLRKYNVKKIIVIDPHTLHVFNHLMPEYIENADYEVVTYIELLDKNIDKLPQKVQDIEYTIHDPCFYARWENVIDPPRNLLEKAGIKINEPKRTKNFTGCCGGPIESIAPIMSKAVAIGRLNELKEASENIITLCPICFANLRRYTKETGTKVSDFAVVLSKAFNL